MAQGRLGALVALRVEVRAAQPAAVVIAALQTQAGEPEEGAVVANLAARR